MMIFLRKDKGFALNIQAKAAIQACEWHVTAQKSPPLKDDGQT